MGKFSIAVIGVGKISIDQHLPALAGNSDFELRALVSGRGVSVAGVPTFATPAELYAAIPDLDAVALNMPPHVRHGFARQALEAGKHVLMEKPPTASVAELDDLVGLAAARRLVLFATWHSQFNAPVDRLRDMLENQAIRSVRIDWRENVKKWHPGQDWVWEPGGFGVFDPGINALSILVKIMPGPVFVTGARLEFPANRGTPIGAEIGLRMTDSQAALSAGFDWRETSGDVWTIRVETENGQVMELAQGGTRLAVDGKPEMESEMQEYPGIYARFSELLAAGHSEVDPRPLWLVADAFLVGERIRSARFEW